MFLVPMTRHSADLARTFDRLFDEGFGERLLNPARPDHNTPRSPALDVSESERAYTVTLDLPGVAKDDVKITIDGRRVQVEAQTTQATEKKDGERVIYSERSLAHWGRSFTLPQELNEAESSAKLDHGVLSLTLAKKGVARATPLKVQ